jgi:hypothetical protein
VTPFRAPLELAGHERTNAGCRGVSRQPPWPPLRELTRDALVWQASGIDVTAVHERVAAQETEL